MGRVLTVLALGRVDWDVAADRFRALIRMKVRVEDDKHDEHTFRNPSVDAGHVSYSRATYRSQGRIYGTRPRLPYDLRTVRAGSVGGPGSVPLCIRN